MMMSRLWKLFIWKQFLITRLWHGKENNKKEEEEEKVTKRRLMAQLTKKKYEKLIDSKQKSLKI